MPEYRNSDPKFLARVSKELNLPDETILQLVAMNFNKKYNAQITPSIYAFYAKNLGIVFREVTKNTADDYYRIRVVKNSDIERIDAEVKAALDDKSIMGEPTTPEQIAYFDKRIAEMKKALREEKLEEKRKSTKKELRYNNNCLEPTTIPMVAFDGDMRSLRRFKERL